MRAAPASAVNSIKCWTTFRTAGTVLLFHSAFDRLLGYGLKYATGFQDTHLGCVGAAGGQ